MPTANSNRKAIFLDRDGTINKNTHYLINFGDFELLPGVETALHIFQNLGYRLFVVSNQSGVARGLFSKEAVASLHAQIQTYLAAKGIFVEELVFCPHHVDGKVAQFTVDCDCRKPKPGMLRYLIEKYDIDNNDSFMVGDNLFDAQAGTNAGCQGVWLTYGHNEAAIRKIDSETISGRPQLDNPPNLKEFVSLLDFAQNLRKFDRLQ